jgi:flavodoxin
MNPCIVYFSRTGNTKRLAEAIAALFKAPIFNITSSTLPVVDAYDTIILGTPVEGASPAKEMLAFVESLPRAEGKKAILFCTYRLFGNARTLKNIEKKLADKGYQTVLKVSKKGMKPEQTADFSDVLAEIKKVM